MANNIFDVHGVSFAYGTKHAVPVFSNLSCSIKEGIVTTLIGANGSGKSTLFSLLTKNLVPQQGEVCLGAANLNEVKLSDFAKKVAIVHQRNTAPSDLSVEKLVGYGRFPYRTPGHIMHSDKDDEMVAWSLELTGLAGLAHKPVSALSGGQMQRVWIAMALAQGTDVLLLDEPTTFLDIRYQLELLDLVRQLNKTQHITIVMVLHDINQAIQCSDEIMALAQGQIVAQGKPQDIITSDLLDQVYGVRLEVTSIHNQPYVLSAQLPEQGVSEEMIPTQEVFRQAPSEQVVSKWVTSEQESCGQNAPEQKTSEQKVSEQKMPDQNTPEQNAFEINSRKESTVDIAVTQSKEAESHEARAEVRAEMRAEAPKRPLRWVWALAGFISFGLGLVGTVLPFLPTTPLILLAAFCFARSSEKLNTWFKSTKVYKKVLEGYVNKRTMTIKAKLSILIPVTILLAIAFILMANVLVGRIVVALVWAAHVVYFGFIVKTDHE